MSSSIVGPSSSSSAASSTPPSSSGRSSLTSSSLAGSHARLTQNGTKHRRGLSGPVPALAGSGAPAERGDDDAPTNTANTGALVELGGEAAPVQSAQRARRPVGPNSANGPVGLPPPAIVTRDSAPGAPVAPLRSPPSLASAGAGAAVAAASALSFRQIRRGKSLDNLNMAAASLGMLDTMFSLMASPSSAVQTLSVPSLYSLGASPSSASSLSSGWERSKPGVYLTEMVLTPPPSSASPTSRAQSPSLMGVAAMAPTPVRQTSLLQTMDEMQGSVESTPLFRGATVLRDCSYPAAHGPATMTGGPERSSLQSPLVGSPVLSSSSSSQLSVTGNSNTPPASTALPRLTSAGRSSENINSMGAGAAQRGSSASGAGAGVDIVLSVDVQLHPPVLLHDGNQSLESVSLLDSRTDTAAVTNQKAGDQPGGTQSEAAAAGDEPPKDHDDYDATNDEEDAGDDESEVESDGNSSVHEEIEDVLQRHGFVDSSNDLLESQSLDSLLPMDSSSVGATGRIASIRNESPRKRRGSIAAWSDPRLSMLLDAFRNAAVDAAGQLVEAGAAGTPGGRLGSGSNLSTLITSLPQALQARVLSYLDLRSLMRARQVCKSWKVLVTSPALTHRLDVSSFHKRVTDDVLRSIAAAFGGHLGILSLRSCWLISDVGVRELASASPHLEMLDVSSCWELTDAAISSLGLSCRRLRCIDLSNCKKIQDRGLEEMLTPLLDLQELKLAYCKSLTDTALQSILMLARRIRALNLQRCTGISDAGWRILRSPENQMSDLVALVLADCSFLSDDTVRSLATGCPALQYLNLSFCCALSPLAIEYLVRGCPKLEALDLSFCGSAVNDDTLLLLGTSLPRLRKLSVRGCVSVTEEGLERLAGELQRPFSLNVTSCRDIQLSTLREALPSSWTLLSGSAPLENFDGLGAFVRPGGAAAGRSRRLSIP